MNKFMYLSLPLISVVFLVGGCTSSGATKPEIDNLVKSNYEKKIQERDQKIAALELSLKEKPVANVVQNEPPATMPDDLLPPNAKAGQCFARTFTPPVYNTENIRVVKKESSERLEIIPAKYQAIEEKILVKEQSERLKVIPAKYEWIKDKILVSPETIKLIPVSAKYKVVAKKVLDKPEHTVWKKGNGPITKIDEATGEIMCLVTIPATYKTVQKRVLVTNATTKKVIVPAKYKIVKRRTLKKEPAVRKITIPAEYKMVKARKLIQPETTRVIPVSEEYTNVVKRFKVKDGVVQWQPVLCKTNISASIIRELQTKLKSKNINPGPIDGYYGNATASAVTTYQKRNKLPSGGLTLETLKSLKIAY